jgi:hypothetical protein
MPKPKAKKVAGPKPRTVPKKAPKLCLRGHRVASKWQPGDDCWQCEADERRRLDAAASAAANTAYRAQKAAELGPLPDDLVLRDHLGRIVSTTRFPRGLRMARRPGTRRRA